MRARSGLVFLAAFTLLALAPIGVAMGAGGGMSTPSPGAGGGGGGPRVDPQVAYREGVQALQAHDYRTAVSRLRSL